MLRIEYKNTYHSAGNVGNRVLVATALAGEVKTGLDDCGNFLPFKDMTRKLTRIEVIINY